MSDEPLAGVVAAGVCTSLGLDAESSLAAVEAGMSRMVETEAFGTGDRSAVCAPLELLSLDTARGRRIHWLAGAAYLDLVRRLSDWNRVDLPLLMVGPEPSADHDVPRDFMITHLRELSEAVVPRPAGEWWTAGGRGGWFAAVATALEMLRGGAPLVLLGAVDSDCDPDSLLRLARRTALLGDDNPQGRIPGEAAVFVLLARPEVPRQIKLRPWAWITALDHGSEPRHLLQRRSTLGEGLTQLFSALRHAHPSWRADAVYSSQPNTNHWGREFKLASLRNAALMPEPMNYHSLHDELGDCGAASPALQLVFAGLRWSRGDALQRALLYGESDDGTLGACLLEAGERAGGR
jgi:3-oxoacyl-[acyl-carrier-protein] synthase I